MGPISIWLFEQIEMLNVCVPSGHLRKIAPLASFTSILTWKHDGSYGALRLQYIVLWYFSFCSKLNTVLKNKYIKSKQIF